MRKTVRFDDLTHGVDLSTPASAIRGPELAWAVNFKPQGSRIKMRGGVRVLNKNLTDGTYGFWPTERAGVWAALAFGPTNVYWLDAGYNETLIGAVGDGTLAPWSISGWNGGDVFAARPNDGLKVVYLNPDFASAAGIAAPTFTPVATDTGAGLLTAGDYSYVCKYRDSRTGARSSYGVVSNTVTTGANRYNLVTGFTPSADQKVTHIDVYRTFPNGSGAYYYVGTVPQTQPFFLDNTVVSAMGEQASATNGLPPSGIISVVEWRARLWITDGRFLYPSKILNPQAYNPLDSIQVGDTINDPIVALLDGDTALIVAKRYSMWYLTGTGATSWEVSRFDKHRGAVSTHSVFYYGKSLYWVSDDAVYESAGLSEGTGVGESSRKLKSIFKSLNTQDPNVLIANAMPDSQGLMFQLNVASPATSGLPHDLRWFFYHLPTRSWWPWEVNVFHGFAGFSGFHNWFRSGKGPNGNSAMWTAIDGWISTWDDESKFGDETGDPFVPGDFAVEIPPLQLSPKYVDFESARGLIGQVGIKMRGEPLLNEGAPSTEVSGTVGLTVYRERRPDIVYGFSPEQHELQPIKIVPILPELTSLTPNSDDSWQRFGLKTVGRPRSSTAGLLISFSQALSRPVGIAAVEMELELDVAPRKIS